jgi:hypothetical protein
MCNWSLYHKGQALAAIRNKLYSGWVDEGVILATVFLMIIDVRLGQSDCPGLADRSRMSFWTSRLTKLICTDSERWPKPSRLQAVKSCLGVLCCRL